ncbi:DDB1- and CUL4-associated factor 1 isoform X2 [Galleria mellonella]|uniref:DDB1- and CUL4-associated factor 1 isoform X2 n=1 Tax=Galleria mellonella TaxID=7137 RepID=A0ABM3MSB7_GALME|nr:DDB1- and CUL4-associated factor 1 isoform X2 [Galleria mellonella]
MDLAPAQEVTELLKQWEEQHTSPLYDPIPTLTRIAEIIEAETENFMKKDPDPFDERHPSRTDPECALGHALKVMFKKDNFMTKLVNDYVRDTYYSRQNITGRDVHKLNVAACRLTLDLMPGLEMSVVFQDNEALIHRLVNWASNSPEPLQCYATGLLAAAMEVQEIATNFRDLNAMLVPLMLRRLHGLRNKGQDEKVNQNSATPPNQTRHFARFDKKRNSEAKCNGPTADSKERETEDSGGGGCEMAVDETPPSTATTHRDPETPVKTYNCNIQIHPPTDATKQMLILRYLTPMGEYQEFLSHVFEQNALGLILGYLNVRESRDSRLAFEALKYLAALLCHKKFSIDFINMGGLQKFLEVPRPSVAATGVSICLYYLAYCEDAMERVCLLPRRILADLVMYALWLLECSHDSGRCHATMFFGLSFQFRVILEEFDNQDGLRKLYNVVSTLPILGGEDEELPVSEDETCAARQIVRHVAVALKRYLEAHLRLRAAQVARQQGDNIPEPPPYKASKSSPEEIQEQIELLQSVAWSRWAPVDELVELGGISLLLQVVGLAYEWNFNGRSETVRSALDVVSVCCVAPRVQLLLTEKLDMRDAELTTGVNIVLGAADGEIVPEPEVQKAALNVLVNCVCAPVHRAGTSTSRFSVGGGGRKRTVLKSYEDVIQKVWESVRTNNGIMVLLSLMMVKSPITDADRLRGLACRALAGLARCPTVRQIISKLPLFTTSQIQVLMRDPILQEKRQEHVMFQKYALELLERVSGKSKRRGAEFETSLANIHRANVVAQTRINYNERQLLQLVGEHLASRGLLESASTLQREAGLPPPAAHPPPPPPPPVYTPSTPLRPRLISRTSSCSSIHRDAAELNSHHPLAHNAHNAHNNSHTDDNPLPPVIKIRKVAQNSPMISSPSPCERALEHKRSLQKQLMGAGGEPVASPHRVTLHSIITEYLYNQHALCKNPVVTCPQFNLFQPHKCPEPRSGVEANLCARVVRRELGSSVGGARANSRYVHGHFAPARTLRLQDDDAYFTHTIFHPTQQQLLAATSSGDIRVFNLFTGVEENSYQVHESYISHMQASRDGLLLLASTPTTWRPFSALFSMKDFEQLFQLDNEEYVEFSKMSDDRIIGTKGETATIFDTLTGRELMTLTPSISNQYAKNRATFNPTDELVLSDGVLWDVNTGKEIHKFDKLNQTHSGVFHPNGLEVISNTEVWDLRTFHLLRTVPTLDKSEVTFNPSHTALYALCSDRDAEERSQFDTSFKTLDAFDYSSIATIEVKRNIYSLGVSPWGTQIALVENVGDIDQVQESCVKVYDVGRKRDHDDDAEEDEEEEMAGGSENDDGSDSGSDNDEDLAASLLRNAVRGLVDGGSSGESSRDGQEVERDDPPAAAAPAPHQQRARARRRRLRSRRRAAERAQSSDSDGDIDIGDLIQFELD